MNNDKWVVFIEWNGDIDYGVCRNTYLAGIFDSEEEAESFCESDRCKQMMEHVDKIDSGWHSGEVTTFTIVFSEQSMDPTYCSGAYYSE